HSHSRPIKNTASQHAYICRPPARCASRSGTLAQLAGGSLRLCTGLQPAALIAASTQPVGIRVSNKDFRQKGSLRKLGFSADGYSAPKYTTIPLQYAPPIPGQSTP